MSGAKPTPLLLIHGFAQTPASWQTVLPHLSPQRPVHAVELRGHGKTALTKGHPSVEGVRRDMTAELDRLGWDRAVVWGYSQGSRVALDLALMAPGRVAALILESGTAGLDAPAERAAREVEDAMLAARIEGGPIEDFVAFWEELPALAGQSPEAIAAQRPDRLAHDPAALAPALRGIGQSAYEPMWDALPGLEPPCLLITGERDRVYGRYAERKIGLIRGAAWAELPGGHAVHIEHPAEAAEAVERFLDRLSSAQAR